ncbi:MAG: succinyl-diaminopimelate desuccinylase [Propionibacteriaceae bacterium]|jgi:succinyl-diaminopimelate desuccinylase|nr:succinyl-diaminopimelate desuccinylase [Propionibacteriaceae bacterium]
MLDPGGDLADLLEAIVDIESVSGQERSLADQIEAALRPCRHLQLTRHGNNICARTELGRPQRVAIAGHLDTVPPAGNLPSRRFQRDGRPMLAGRGSVDMKGGLAVQLALAVALSQPRWDLSWIFYDNEEVEAARNGLGRLAQARPDLLQADFAILMEPTAAVVEGGCQGSLRAWVTTKGRSAHAARSWLGHNAIHDMAPVLETLRQYQPRRVEVDGLEYREGLNAVIVEGGSATNVVPDRCRLQVNYRFSPDQSLEQAEARLREILAGHELDLVDRAPGARPGLTTPWAAELVAASGQAARPKYGWTDVARFAALGLPAVNFGPGDPNLAHTVEEAVELDQVAACHAVLAGWLS